MYVVTFQLRKAQRVNFELQSGMFWKIWNGSLCQEWCRGCLMSTVSKMLILFRCDTGIFCFVFFLW